MDSCATSNECASVSHDSRHLKQTVWGGAVMIWIVFYIKSAVPVHSLWGSKRLSRQGVSGSASMQLQPQYFSGVLRVNTSSKMRHFSLKTAYTSLCEFALCCIPQIPEVGHSHLWFTIKAEIRQVEHRLHTEGSSLIFRVVQENMNWNCLWYTIYNYLHHWPITQIFN